VHPQAVRNGGVNVQRFGRYTLALLIRHVPQRAHVVQPISQLDQNHPNITGHGQCHFLEVFRLRLGTSAELNLGQLAHTVDQIRHRLTKLFCQGIFGNTGVFDHIVQHRRHQALMVKLHVCKNVRDRQRVRNVMLTGTAHLACMGLFGIIVCPAHLINPWRIKVGTELVRQLVDRHRRNGISRIGRGCTGFRECRSLC